MYYQWTIVKIIFRLFFYMPALTFLVIYIQQMLVYKPNLGMAENIISISVNQGTIKV